MARVTEAEVQAIMEDYPDDLDPYIAVATLLVDEELDGLGMSDSRLKEIERWLSAHFAATATPLAKAEGVGKISQTLQRGRDGEGLATTQYGQNAIALDSSGTLAALSKGRKTVVDFGAVQEPWQEDTTT